MRKVCSVRFLSSYNKIDDNIWSYGFPVTIKRPPYKAATKPTNIARGINGKPGFEGALFPAETEST